MSSDLNLRQAILGGAFIYTPRPDPMPGDLRMSWGLAVLVLALFFSRGKRSNFQKLQFLAHAVRLSEGREEVLGLISGKYKPSEVSVRVEPSLNRAVAYGHALRLVEIERGTSVSLTEDGQRMAEAIATSDDTMKAEVSFLREVAPKMTDTLMKRVWRLEELL